MQLTLTVLSALAATVAGQSLTQALNSSTDLSQLTSLISQYPALVQTLSNATNITILAPSNQAIAALLNSTSPALLSNADAVQAILSYHVLKGSYPSSSIKSTPAFVPTLLNNTQYSNITGGQVVEAITQGSSVEIYSGLLSKSNVTKAVSDCDPKTPTHTNTLSECQLHWRCNSRHRQGVERAAKHLIHCPASWSQCIGRSPDQSQFGLCASRPQGCDRLRSVQCCLPGNWLCYWQLDH